MGEAPCRTDYNDDGNSDQGDVMALIQDIAAGTQVVGAPFEDTVDAASVDPIEFQFLPTDPIEGKSLFDGLDFAALDDDADGSVSIGPGDEAHNILRRTLQSHVHYNASPR